MGEPCPLARVTGKASAVVLDDFWYRLILAVELAVFFLLLSNFVMPFVVAGYFVQRAINLWPVGQGLVIELIHDFAFSLILGCNAAFLQHPIP